MSFADLSIDQQIESLVEPARLALSQYGLHTVVLQNINHEYNSTFAVETQDGARYALRLNINSHRTEAHIAAEVFFIQLLAKTGECNVALPVSNSAGAFVTKVPHPEGGRTILCVLFTWLDGEDVGDDPSEDQVFDVGRVMARMHEATEGVSLPEGAELPRFDDFFWQEEDLLLPHSALSVAEKTSFQAARKSIEAVIQDLYAHTSPQLIHADLHGWNLKWRDNRLSVFDFDDAGIGLPIQDLATALYYLDTDQHRALMKAGYASVRPLPECTDYQMDSLLLQRRIHLLNYLYDTENPEHRDVLPGYQQETLRRVEVYLRQRP